MRGSFRLGRISGIEIGIHYSWILIFVLVATTLALGLFPNAVPNISSATAWLAGIVAAILLFASVLAHELAHSLVAQARGIPVKSITLFILGGVSNIEEEAKKPGIEFTMAVVGPLMSLVLAAIFWGVYFLVQNGATGNPFTLPAQGGYKTVGAAILHYLAYVNGLLAIFNILPGFPLDGGRVLRSIIWGATGNLIRATNIAATIGRLFGWGLIAFGIYGIFTNNLVGGIWIGIIGWFLSSAADSSRHETTLRERLTGAKVKDAMVLHETISPGTPVDELVRGFMNQKYGRAVPVCDGGMTVGIVTLKDVKRVAQDRWPVTSVESVMTKTPLYSVKPDDDLNQAMKLIAQHDLNQVLVTSEGQCVGLLSRAEIIHYLNLSEELNIKGKKGGEPS